MLTFAFLSPLMAGLALGALGVWLRLRQAGAGCREENAGLRATLTEARTALAAADARYVTAQEQIQQLTAANATANAQLEAERACLGRERAALDKQIADMRVVFENSANEVLRRQSAALKQDAGELLAHKQAAIEGVLAPLREALDKIEGRANQMESARVSAYSELKSKIDDVLRASSELQQEAAKLSTALSSPVTSGDWGEHLLEQVVTLAGMTEYCNFEHQVTSKDGRYRPDMIVALPNGRKIIVDAKTSVKTFLEAYGTLDEKLRREKLSEHCKKLRGQITLLAKNRYEQRFEDALDLVVCFVPGDVFHVAALSVDRELWEFAAAQKVLLATPTTLLGLLKAVAYGWQQDALSKEVLQVRKLGEELYGRLVTALGHLGHLRRSIGGTVSHFDAFVGSLQASVFPAARRMKKLGLQGSELPEVGPIETHPRVLAMPEAGPRPEPLLELAAMEN